MGAAWGDLNCDGNLDMVATDVGSYIVSVELNTGTFPSGVLGHVEFVESTQWTYGFGDGTFFNPFPEAPSAQWYYTTFLYPFLLQDVIMNKLFCLHQTTLSHSGLLHLVCHLTLFLK